MVKVVVGDESHLKLIENRLTGSSLPSQVGLVIGKLNSKLDRGFVYDLVPTPPNDAGEPPCSIIEESKKKNSSKGKSHLESSSALFIDKDWVSEHARQVSRMLLGGMKVVGIYIWANESLFKNATLILCQTVKGVAEAAPMMSEWNERLLVHISYSPLRWTCRNCSLAANITSSSLQPCDFKLGKVLASLQAFRCTYNFEIRLPIVHEAGFDIKRLADVLRYEITIQAKELTGARALMNGKLVIEDDQCVSGDFHEVEFLLPFSQDKNIEACSNKEVLGILLFSGSVCSLAYLNTKEPVSQAFTDIKEDVIRSLQSRLEIMCDAADIEMESIADGDQEAKTQVPTEGPVLYSDLKVQKKPCRLSFPRRVFIPWLDGTYICDYIQPSENMEVLKEHCVELMSLEFPADDSEIMEPESDAPTVVVSTAKSFWDVAIDNSSTVNQAKSLSNKTDEKTSKLSDLISVLAILVVIVAIVLGLYVSATS